MKQLFISILIIAGFFQKTHGQVLKFGLNVFNSMYSEDFKADTSYHKKNSIRLIPLKKDSMFLQEEILVFFHEKAISQKAFHKEVEAFNNGSADVFEVVNFKNQGYAHFNEFYDYWGSGESHSFDTYFYARKLYIRFWKKKNVSFEFLYRCYLRPFAVNSLVTDEHFRKKMLLVEQLFNSVKM